MSKENIENLTDEELDLLEEQEDIEIEMNMLRERAEKADTVTDEMWLKIKEEHRLLVEEYLDVSTHLSKQTLIQYRSGLRQFFWWNYEILNDKDLHKISKRDFMRYMSYLTNRGLSSSALGFKKSAVSAFNIYIENIISEDDPTYATFRNFTKGSAQIPKNQVYKKEAITEDEYKLIMETLEADENYLGMAWVATAFNSGARRAEIPQIKTEVLDYQITDDSNYVMSNTVFAKGRAGGKPVEYMLNTEVLKYMKLWVDKRGYSHDYVFTLGQDESIRTMSNSWANRFCTDVLSDILGRRINPHLFKSSCITALLSQNVPMNIVSKYIGQHESVETTAIYDLRDFEEEKGQIFKHLK